MLLMGAHEDWNDETGFTLPGFYIKCSFPGCSPKKPPTVEGYEVSAASISGFRKNTSAVGAWPGALIHLWEHPKTHENA
jgi:hypothetical protein